MKFTIFCSSEHRDIGILDIPSNTDLSADVILAKFKPEMNKYYFVDHNGKPTLRDGQQALCPVCGTPLLLRDPDSNEMKGVYLVPGLLKVGQ